MSQNKISEIKLSFEDDIFFGQQPLIDILDDTDMKKMMNDINDFIYNHFENTNDFRASIIITSIAVEEEIEKNLNNLMPKFKDVFEKQSFTFSMKIKMLRAFDIIPPRVLNAADKIRDIRNLLAHNILDKNIQERKMESFMNSINDHLKNLIMAESKLTYTNNKQLYTCFVMALLMYLGVYYVVFNKHKKYFYSEEHIKNYISHISQT